MTPDIWMILAFAGLLIAGVPVAFSLALSGAVGIVLGLSPDMLATLVPIPITASLNTLSLRFHCLFSPG